MFDTIVLATDGSASAERAVTLALDFADRFDADFHVCTVLEDRDDGDREDAQAALDTVQTRTDGVTTTLLEGDATEEICAYAEDIDADLVVTGTRGRHGEHAYLLGSVAESVVRESPAPVLTARQLADDAPDGALADGGE
jgi:nucleotide-binding universal stress UspA family protein